MLRTNNNPVADYSEWLVWKAFGAERLPANSTASYDLTSQDFGRIQVKARVVSSPLKSGQLQTSPFRSTHFDHAAPVLSCCRTSTTASCLQYCCHWGPSRKGGRGTSTSVVGVSR